MFGNKVCVLIMIQPLYYSHNMRTSDKFFHHLKVILITLIHGRIFVHGVITTIFRGLIKATIIRYFLDELLFLVGLYHGYFLSQIRIRANSIWYL
jgi:hypothetical protein